MNNSINAKPTPEQIAERAYQVWENEGGAYGRLEAHWLQTERHKGGRPMTARQRGIPGEA